MTKKLLLLLVALTPFNRLRIFLYRFLFGYRISYDSAIGFGNFLYLAECDITNARIGRFNDVRANCLIMAPGSIIDRFNRFNQVNRIELARRSRIMTRNRFVGTRPGLTPFKEHENFYLGEDSNVTAGHLFDLSDSITVGKNVTFGGRGTEVWTHGFDLNHVKIQAPVIFDCDIYVGSHCIFIQGIHIAGGVSIGAGTVVAKSIIEPGFYISSQLVRKADIPDYSRADAVIIHNQARFVKK